MTFHVIFNSETNESSCNCRLFEFRGIVCKHQLVVWQHNRVQRVPDKYVLRRWRKDVTRAHTKIRIRYENSSRTIEEIRSDEMRKAADEVVNLAKDSEVRFDEYMEVHKNLKKKYLMPSAEVGSNTGSVIGSRTDSVVGDDPSKDSPIILDPESIKPKGRSRKKRLVGKGDEIRKNVKERKRKEQKKEEQKDKLKKVAQEVLPDLNDDFAVQENFPVYSEQFMWTNIEQSVSASQVWGSNVPSSSSFRDYF